MKIRHYKSPLPTNVTVAVFKEDGVSVKRAFFCGSGRRFNRWKYKGPDQPIVFRVRKAGIIPFESTGILTSTHIILHGPFMLLKDEIVLDPKPIKEDTVLEEVKVVFT